MPDAVEAMRLGAANFAQKPVDADELLPVLHAATPRWASGSGAPSASASDAVDFPAREVRRCDGEEVCLSGRRWQRTPSGAVGAFEDAFDAEGWGGELYPAVD